MQLYRDADVVAVSVHENKYAAGVQLRFAQEGTACGRPRDPAERGAAAIGPLRADDGVVTGLRDPAMRLALRAAAEQTLGDRRRRRGAGL